MAGRPEKARRVTGFLAGAMLGPTVCGGCERGEWHFTKPTTGAGSLEMTEG